MPALVAAIEREDAEAAFYFYTAHSPPGENLIRAHVRRLIAINRIHLGGRRSGNEVRQALKRAGLAPTPSLATTEASHNE